MELWRASCDNNMIVCDKGHRLDVASWGEECPVCTRDISGIGRLLRKLGLSFSVSYRVGSRGRGQSGWKWNVGVFGRDDYHIHFSGNRLERAMDKMIKRLF